MQTHVVAKTAVFNDEGKLLVMRRYADDPHRPGGADIPGGKIDEGEAIVDGALREMYEESGLTVIPAGLELVYATTKTGYNTEFKTDINFVWLGFVAKFPKGQKVHLSFEHDKFDWLTIDEAIAGSNAPSHVSLLKHLKAQNIAPELWQLKKV